MSTNSDDAQQAESMHPHLDEPQRSLSFKVAAPDLTTTSSSFHSTSSSSESSSFLIGEVMREHLGGEHQQQGQQS